VAYNFHLTEWLRVVEFYPHVSLRFLRVILGIPTTIFELYNEILTAISVFFEHM
jgi:hypothetical protein